MLSIPLGPLAIPVAPLLLLASLWLASFVASRLARRAGLSEVAADAMFHASLLGLAAARIVHLALNVDAYAASPLSMLDLRDGGWHGPAGVAAGAAWLAWRVLRAPALRTPLAAGALAAVVAWSVGSFATGRHDRPPLPELAVVDLATGRRTTLAEAAAGRPAVVNLWASWCAPCREEMPVLSAAQQRDPGIAFLFVNQGEPPQAVRAYLARLGLPLRDVLLDAGSALGPAVGSRGLPTTLFHDAQGRRVDAHFGVLNGPALEARLKALRAGH